MYFNANCKILGSREVRITPNVLVLLKLVNADVEAVVPRGSGRKLLVTLYAPARNSILWLSRTRNTLDSAISRDQVPGPVILLWPTFPVVPRSGCAKAAAFR